MVASGLSAVRRLGNPGRLSAQSATICKLQQWPASLAGRGARPFARGKTGIYRGLAPCSPLTMVLPCAAAPRWRSNPPPARERVSPALVPACSAGSACCTASLSLAPFSRMITKGARLLRHNLSHFCPRARLYFRCCLQALPSSLVRRGKLIPLLPIGLYTFSSDIIVTSGFRWTSSPMLSYDGCNITLSCLHFNR
jgi:hypothetical protein